MINEKRVAMARVESKLDRSFLDNSKPASKELFPFKLYNKVEGSKQLDNKKALFSNLMDYYVGKGEDPHLTLPVTFHIKDIIDPAYEEFR